MPRGTLRYSVQSAPAGQGLRMPVSSMYPQAGMDCL